MDTGSNPVTSTKVNNMSKILALSNQKGGVGKTTTAVNLGYALAKRGAKCLICDIDPQGNATTGVGIDRRKLKNSVYDLIIGQSTFDDIVMQSPYENLYVMPSKVDLAGAEVELVDIEKREHRLKMGLEKAKQEFEYTLIDCPPSLGLLTINALVAADQVLIPIQTEYYALEGLSQLLSTVNRIHRTLNPTLSIFGVLLTMYDERTTLSRQVASEVKKYFGEQLFQSVVPRNVRVSEAPSYGQPISVYDPTSKGAHSYEQLAEEVLRGGR